MQSYEAKASAVVKASAAQVYGILADYHQGHPHILPEQFNNVTVTHGGIGAGTQLRFTMTVMGQTHHFQSVVTEPEPGRVLVESNSSATMPPSVTTFTVEPLAGSAHCQVTIQTQSQSRDGLAGVIERLVSKRFLQGVYAQELALLTAYAEGQAQP
jgi:hypothetical protein